jgi:hypothetical protein
VTKSAEGNKGAAGSSLLKYGLLAAGGYFVDLVLPALLGMTAWYLLAGSVGLWKLSRTLFVAVFFVLFVAVGLLAYGLLRTLVNWRKRILPHIRKNWTDNPQKRLVDIALFGLIVPIALSLAANLVPVSSGDPLLVALERRWSTDAAASAVTRVADASLATSSLETKRQAIETLQAIGSEAGRQELFRLLEEDPDALHDYRYYAALRDALASFGEPARVDLVDLLGARAEMPEESGGSPVPGLYDIFFDAAFESLREQIVAGAAQPDATSAMLQAVDALQVDLTRGLDRLDEQGGLAEGGDPTLNLVLDTLLDMGAQEGDKVTYRLVRTLAEDEARSGATRARALLLVATLGTIDDVPFLVSFLEDGDPVLQRAALGAIAILHGGDAEE